MTLPAKQVGLALLSLADECSASARQRFHLLPPVSHWETGLVEGCMPADGGTIQGITATDDQQVLHVSSLTGTGLQPVTKKGN